VLVLVVVMGERGACKRIPILVQLLAFYSFVAMYLSHDGSEIEQLAQGVGVMMRFGARDEDLKRSCALSARDEVVWHA